MFSVIQLGSKDECSDPPPAHSSDREEGLIKLDVLVTDSSGKPVPGLHSNDFALLENGQPNRIVSFHAFDGVSAQPESPVEVILVIDMLQLPINLIMMEQSSVEAFLRKDDGHLAEPVRILTLQESGIWQVADASRDGKALAAQVAHTTQFHLIHRFGAGGIRGSPVPTGPPSINALRRNRRDGETEAGEKTASVGRPWKGYGSHRPQGEHLLYNLLVLHAAAGVADRSL